MKSTHTLALSVALAFLTTACFDLSGLDQIGAFGEEWAESVTDHGPSGGSWPNMPLGEPRTTAVYFEVDTLRLESGTSGSVVIHLEDGHPTWVSSHPEVAAPTYPPTDTSRLAIEARAPGVTRVYGIGIVNTTVRHTDTLIVVVQDPPTGPLPDPYGCDIERPNPLLAYEGFEDREGSDGRPYRHYRLSILNRREFPAAMFELTSEFGACGSNQNPSRTWVEIFRASGERLYGFCALTAPEQLGTLWFSLPPREAPPDVYVELRDRACERTYVSDVVVLE